MTHRHLVLPLLLLAGACASVPMASPQEDQLGKRFEPPPPDKAAIYLYREGIMGALVPVDVTVQAAHGSGGGGGLDVSLVPDTWVRIQGEPGPIEVRCARDQAPGQRLDMRPGETRYVEVSYKLALWGTTCAVQEVSELTGQRGVAGGRRAVAGGGGR